MIRLFRHYIPRGLLILALAEVAILLSAIFLGRSLRYFTAPYSMVQHRLADLPLSAFVFMLVMMLIFIGMGLYERNFWEGKADMILRVGVSFLLGLFVMTLMYYIFPDLYLGRVEFGYAFSGAFIGVISARYIFFNLSDNDALKRRVLVLGTGLAAKQIEGVIGNSNVQGFNIIGFVPVGNSKDCIASGKMLAIESSVYALAEQYQIDQIVVATDYMAPDFPTEDILDCKISGVNIVDLFNFFEQETGRIRLDTLGPGNIIFSDGFQQAVLKRISKRAFDIAASSLLLLLTWPIMLLTVLAISFESGFREPILYRQVRVGKDEQPFEVLKFRSMRVDAEHDGVARWAQQNDSRITRVGSFIRSTRIDELPQLLNVLKGNMSFVGPRPERPQFVIELSQSIPFYSMRHCVKPGITGWAQICYPYGASEQDAREKLQYDLYYIKNYSLFLDLMVLLQTAHVIFWGKGAR